MKKRFRAVATRYDIFSLSVPHHDSFQNSIGVNLSSFLQTDASQGIELGCGTGITTDAILKYCPDITLTCVDNEIDMMNQVSERIIRPTINFVLMDALAFLKTCESNSQDFIVSAFMLHNLPAHYRQEVCEETARVLKPHGLFLNGDKYARDNPIQHLHDLCEQLKNFDVFFEEADEEYWAEWIQHYLDDDQIKFTEEEQRTILSKHFTAIQFIERQRMEALCIATKKGE